MGETRERAWFMALQFAAYESQIISGELKILEEFLESVKALETGGVFDVKTPEQLELFKKYKGTLAKLSHHRATQKKREKALEPKVT